MILDLSRFLCFSMDPWRLFLVLNVMQS
jgi:hypothetical protein